MKTKILITVEKGQVMSVDTNHDNVQIIIIDKDDQGSGIEISEILEPDAIVENMYELYTNATSSVDKKIWEVLKTKKF
jgi:hypothetical protein